MSDSTSIRRLTENEVYFRQHNQQMRRDMATFRRMAKRHGQEALLDDSEAPLYFYCECANEACRDRVPLSPSLYDSIHRKKNRFVVVSGHDVRQVEQVVEQEAGYDVVEKFDVPPETAARLNRTHLSGS